MKHESADRLSRGDSPVHRLSPGLKTGAAIAFILAVTLTPFRAGAAFAAAGALLIGAILFGRVPASYLLKRALLLEPVIVAVAGLALFQPGGGARFAAMAVKSTLCVTSVLVLSATTPASGILSFFRKLGVPSILTSMAALTVRYVYVLGDELRRMRRARRSRTFSRGRARAWRSASAAAGHLFVRSADRAERIYRAMSGTGMAMSPAAVEIRDLRYRYPDGRVGLDGVTLAIEEGETVGLVGPNGAGKSTLLMHLNGILPDAHRGEPAVFIHGIPVGKATLLRIRREVGLLFEDPDDQLLSPTVWEDVAFGPRQWDWPEAEVEAAVRQALSDVGLDGFGRLSPHHLSNGEKQRVCLAGIMVSRPKVLALDEPTRALDPRGRRRLLEILRGLPAVKIIATHDLELVAALCDRAFVLDGGRIVASGQTAEILADEPLMLAHGLETPYSLKRGLGR